MKRKVLIIFAIGVISLISVQLNGWFDETLFYSGSATYSIMKPNILIMMDNSGSMNNLIYHPDYNPGTAYTEYSDQIIGTSEYNISYKKKGTYYDPHQGRWRYFSVSQYYLCRGTNELIYPVTTTTFDGVYMLDIRNYPYANAHPAASVIYLFAEPDSGNAVRIGGNFLNFSLYQADSDQVAEWNHFMKYGTWDTADTANIDGNDGMNRKVRMRVAREVMKNAVDDMFTEYDADPNPDKVYPRIGISRFNSDEGGTVIQSPGANANRTATKVLIDGIEGTTWTPLSEAYAEVYAYFRNGGECSISDSKYFLDLDDPGSQNISSSTPISNWCQLNFIIVVTDGEPTQDVQLRDLPANSIFYINPDHSVSWGDTDVSGLNDDDTATLDSYGTNYLDDLAWFAYNNDLWPDDKAAIASDSRFETHMKNKQFIYTYAIGFAIDNTLLRDTADNGGGEYYTAKDYDSLASALRNAFASIDEKVRAYAAFAAPKYSLTYGDRSGYVATFVPKATQNVWEGHLKSYKLDDQGDFPDLENPGTALEWDAGEVLNNRVSPRVIYTIKEGNLVNFDSADLIPADLGFSTGDAALDNEYRDKVIDFVRGNNTYGWKLGDIFHFTPTVVGAPLKWKASFDSIYNLFFDELTEWVEVDGELKLVSKRPEVVYVGANDGMLHCFRVDTGEELWAFIPPSFLKRLKDMVPDVPSDPGVTKGHQYFIDGKAIAKDIKVEDKKAWTDWRTVLIFGYGFGGESYCALDVTDPESVKFLWEFNDPSYSGLTEGKPIIARLQNDGSGSQFDAVILSGGYDISEEPATAPNLKGKSFFILNAYTGNIVKKFIYDSVKTESKVGATYIHTNPDFLYCFAATPAALDYDNNGLTDYLYMAESGDYLGTANQGGRLWKINLNGDPSGWDPVNIFQAEDGQTFWLPPTIGYDYDYNLWLFIGSGHRPSPNNPNNLTGQFIGIIDSSLSSPLTLSSLTDVGSLFSATEPDPVTAGFWFDYNNGPGETIFEPDPIFLNSTIYFNTYTPTTTSLKITDPCVQEGNQNIYSFRVRTGNGVINIEDLNIEAGKIQGSGLLSGGKYKIYKGSGVVGSTDVIEQETIDLESVFGSMTWEEKKR